MISLQIPAKGGPKFPLRPSTTTGLDILNDLSVKLGPKLAASRVAQVLKGPLVQNRKFSRSGTEPRFRLLPKSSEKPGPRQGEHTEAFSPCKGNFQDVTMIPRYRPAPRGRNVQTHKSASLTSKSLHKKLHAKRAILKSNLEKVFRQRASIKVKLLLNSFESQAIVQFREILVSFALFDPKAKNRVRQRWSPKTGTRESIWSLGTL